MILGNENMWKSIAYSGINARAKRSSKIIGFRHDLRFNGNGFGVRKCLFVNAEKSSHYLTHILKREYLDLCIDAIFTNDGNRSQHVKIDLTHGDFVTEKVKYGKPGATRPGIESDGV